MKAIVGHRIATNPTSEQENWFARAVGTSRFAYNWALEEWQRQYREGQKPNEGKLRKLINESKGEQFPWMYEVPKSVVQQAIKNLGVAFANFFEHGAGYPNFKKKGVDDAARLDNGPGTFALFGKKIKLPTLGWVKLREELRFSGRPLSVTLSRTADRWFVSVAVEITLEDPPCENQAIVGVDLGISTAVVLSNGKKFEGPRPLKRYLKKLRRLSKKHSRAKAGSENRKKLARDLARLHAKIASIREDWLHERTTWLVRNFGVICIEDLNVKGMAKNKKLARHIHDIGMGEFRRQLVYKCKLYGVKLVIADRWFPSSKKCSTQGCDFIWKNLPLSVREWRCPSCGVLQDRDVNAAKNLASVARSAVSCTVAACGEVGPALHGNQGTPGVAADLHEAGILP